MRFLFFYSVPSLLSAVVFLCSEYGGWEYPGSNAVLTNGLLSPWMLVSLPYNTTARLDRNVLSYTYEAGPDLCSLVGVMSPGTVPGVVAAAYQSGAERLLAMQDVRRGGWRETWCRVSR